MDRDSSDEDLEIEKVCSQSEAKVYTEVPSDTNYKFKMKNSAGKTYRLMEYTLNKGKKLPHFTIIKG